MTFGRYRVFLKSAQICRISPAPFFSVEVLQCGRGNRPTKSFPRVIGSCTLACVHTCQMDHDCFSRMRKDSHLQQTRHFLIDSRRHVLLVYFPQLRRVLVSSSADKLLAGLMPVTSAGAEGFYSRSTFPVWLAPAHSLLRTLQFFTFVGKRGLHDQACTIGKSRESQGKKSSSTSGSALIVGASVKSLRLAGHPRGISSNGVRTQSSDLVMIVSVGKVGSTLS